MIFAVPDFYSEFHCKASACQHSCCKGWEIDIDEESFEYYRTLDGKFGNRLREVICEEPEPHFILRKDESCPFLQENGLCEMILKLGEDSLCDICREHPRFYNEFPGRLEMGVGLCCEEAVHLLLAGDEPLKIIEWTEDDESADAEDAEIKRRKQLFSILAEQTAPLAVRMERAVNSMGGAVPPIAPASAAAFCRTLEQLDPAWSPFLEQLCTADGKRILHLPDGIHYERILEYFLFRHFAVGETEREQLLRLQFSVLSTMLLCCLEQVTQMPLEELLRMYSSEIEYSDENVEKLLRYIEQELSESQEKSKGVKNCEHQTKR